MNAVVVANCRLTCCPLFQFGASTHSPELPTGVIELPVAAAAHNTNRLLNKLHTCVLVQPLLPAVGNCLAAFPASSRMMSSAY
jgi:hypothetical protein